MGREGEETEIATMLEHLEFSKRQLIQTKLY